MTDVLNLDAESNRNIIGDDSSATLMLENTSSGECLKLQNAAGSGTQLSTVSCPTTSVYVVSGALGAKIHGVGGVDVRSTATSSPAAEFVHTTLGSPTIGVIRATQSTASGAFMTFRGAVISTASLNVSADKVVAAVRVSVEGDAGGILENGYIPVLTVV